MALNEIKSKPLARRLTGVFSEGPLGYNDEVFCDNKKIGFIVNANRFISGNGSIGLAMLDIPYAVSGIPCFEVLLKGEKAPLKTVSPPFIRNRSLYIDPQIHAYQERETISFPPITGE